MQAAGQLPVYILPANSSFSGHVREEHGQAGHNNGLRHLTSPSQVLFSSIIANILALLAAGSPI